MLRRDVIHIRKRKSLLYEGKIVGLNKKKKYPPTKDPVVTMSGRVIKHPKRLGITNSNV